MAKDLDTPSKAVLDFEDGDVKRVDHADDADADDGTEGETDEDTEAGE